MEGVNDGTYKLDELARAAGTSPRTVRYYVQRGLLPAPAFRGKDTAYGADHLLRLRAIRRLQEAFFPLDAIAIELDRRSPAELERLVAGTDVPGQAPVPAAPRPSSPAARQIAHPVPSSHRPRVVRRYELAPGVELSVEDGAPLASRRVVEKILDDLQRRDGEEGA